MLLLLLLPTLVPSEIGLFLSPALTAEEEDALGREECMWPDDDEEVLVVADEELLGGGDERLYPPVRLTEEEGEG